MKKIEIDFKSERRYKYFINEIKEFIKRNVNKINQFHGSIYIETTHKENFILKIDDVSKIEIKNDHVTFLIRRLIEDHVAELVRIIRIDSIILFDMECENGMKEITEEDISNNNNHGMIS